MKSNLLTVDDRPENLLVLKALLGPNYNLIQAHSGQEALDLVAKEPVDVVLLDIEMPVMDGYETARRMKEMECCQNIPIIFISGVFMDDPYVRKGYECGAVDYFTKPFDPSILRRKIAIYASLRRQEMLLKEKEQRIKELEELLSRSVH